MTPEQLDEARADEGWRIWDEMGRPDEVRPGWIVARLAREGWKPPEPVDPDLLAFREWAAERNPPHREAIMKGEWDSLSSVRLSSRCMFLAGARMAREQERERIKELEARVKELEGRARSLALSNHTVPSATPGLIYNIPVSAYSPTSKRGGQS